MAANLIELAKGYLTSEVVHRLSSVLGQSPEHVEKAVDAGIPSILAGFLNTASSSGANRLFEMVKHEPPELAHLGGLDGAFGNLGSLLSEGSVDSLVKYGQNLLSFLFGGKLDSIVGLITRSSGMKPSSAGSLMGMLAPLLMGLVRKETISRGLSPAGLTDLLMSQKDAIARQAPAGLTSALGLRSLADLGAASDSIKAAGAGAARKVGRTAATAAGEGAGWLRWAAPLALLAACGLGLFYWFGGRRERPVNPAEPPEVAQATRTDTDRAAERVEGTTQAVKETSKRLTVDGKTLVETVSRKVMLSLPGGIKLEVPENSYLQSMVKFFNQGADAPSSKSFVANDLEFEGTTNQLTHDSSTAVTSLATVMKAFSTAKLKIEGHTDNVGDPAENKKISLERATAVKDALVKAGVSADRITVEGLGPDRPIASNDTEEGRAKNRQIELVIVSR